MVSTILFCTRHPRQQVPGFEGTALRERENDSDRQYKTPLRGTHSLRQLSMSNLLVLVIQAVKANCQRYHKGNDPQTAPFQGQYAAETDYGYSDRLSCYPVALAHETNSAWKPLPSGGGGNAQFPFKS